MRVGLGVLIFAISILSTNARAEQGVVVLERTPRCDKFIVETTMGYSLLEWFGGAISIETGDAVYGQLNSFGFKDIFINGRGEMRVWIDDYMADAEKAKEYFYSGCS